MDKNGSIQPFMLEDGQVALLTPEWIITEVPKDHVEGIVNQISTVEGNELPKWDEDKVISIQAIDEIEADQRNRDIVITYKVDGGYKAKILTMQAEEFKKSFIDTIYEGMKKDYTSEIKEYSRLKACVAPLVAIALVLVAGAFFTWFAYVIETQGGPHRTMRVKFYVYIIYQVLKWIKPIGAEILTGLAVLGCLAWMVRRVKTPPIKLIIAKKN